MDFFQVVQGFDPLNIAFGINFLSLMVKDILKLRLLAFGSQITFMLVGYSRGNWTIFWWQIVFILINLVRTGLLLWERREIHFSDDLEEIYKNHFPTFTRGEFLIFWNAGEEITGSGVPITREGEDLGALWFLHEGSADVIKSKKRLTQVPPGHFIGEMSFLTGSKASADVVPIGEVKLHTWAYTVLDRIKKTRPGLWTKIQGRLGRDLVSKIWAQHHIPKLEAEGMC